MMQPGTQKVFPHLWYAEDAEAAASFYASVFPDSSVDSVVTMLSDSPSGPAGSVAVVDFTLMRQRFQAISAGPHHDFNDAILPLGASLLASLAMDALPLEQNR